MNTYLFVNPLSGGHTAQRITSVISLLNKAGLKPIVFTVITPDDARCSCRIINESAETALVIIAAGDGTVNAVLNSLMPGRVTLAVLPLGTSNVLAAELGIHSVEVGVKRIIAGKTRPLSVGVLEMNTVGHRFVLMAGIGFDGAVVRDVRPLAKRLLKKGAYALSAVLSTVKWDTSLIDVITPAQTVACHTAIVCNASRYGGTSVLAPATDLFSPEFSVVCIRKSRRLTYHRLAVDLLLGRLHASREIIHIPADRVEIRGTKPIQIDGDFIGYSPATLKSMADFARIVV